MLMTLQICPEISRSNGPGLLWS